MSITRSRLTFEDHFTQLPNRWARDGRLTLKARGLLAQLLSHRAGWRVSVSALVAANPEGRDAIRSALTELLEHGYLVRSDDQVHQEDGTFGSYEYALADPWADQPSSGNPSTVSPAETGHKPSSEPSSGYPTSGEPSSGNPLHKKTIPTEDHLKEDQENNVGDSAAVVPVREDVAEVCRIVADHVTLVTGSAPRVGARWEQQARLMLDADGHTVDDVRAVMAWVSASAFWAPNVLSVPKLREKWPTLVGQARRDMGRSSWLQQELGRAAAYSAGAGS